MTGHPQGFVVQSRKGSDHPNYLSHIRIDLAGTSTGQGSLEDLVLYRIYDVAGGNDDGSPEDPYLLGIHDLDGELIPGTSNDDSGTGLNSRLAFEAPYTGVYYIVAGAYEDYTRGYTLAVMDVL